MEGLVFSASPNTSSFQMVALENISALSSSVLGSPVNVTVQPGATFQVDQDGLSVNSNLVSSFNGVSAVIVGQDIQVRRVSGDGSTATPIVADRVRLRMSRFTAKVATKVDANTFTVDTSTIKLFSDNGITQITVDASQAQFEPSTVNVSSLQVGDTVSLRGLLFKQAAPTSPLLVASKVRKR